MTANELLALLGRAWSRLLIYPGGLAFGLIWLIGTFQNREPRTKNHSGVRRGGSWFLVLSSIALPWLALALLPLPLAVALPRQIDIVVALALLEWPNLLAIRQELRAGDMRRLAAALNSYPPLILATLALAQAGNSLELAALARAPGSLAAISTSALHWFGAVALALVLPPALGIGPFADDRRPTLRRRSGQATDPSTLRHAQGEPPRFLSVSKGRAGDRPFDAAQGRRPTLRRRSGQAIRDEAFSPSPIPYPPSPIPISVAGFFEAGAIQIGLRLRALGLVALAALPWAGAEGTGLALLRVVGAAALIAALLWGFDRLTRRQAARRWARAYLALGAALLLALLGAAYLALQIRLA